MSIKTRFSIILSLFVPDFVIKHHNRAVHWNVPQEWRSSDLTNLTEITRDYSADRRLKVRRHYLGLLKAGISTEKAMRMAITDSRV